MTNADFEKIVDTSDEWILTRTGIRERRICNSTIANSDMCSAACQNALAMSGVAHEDIDALIVGTVTADYTLPSLSCVVQEKIKLPNAVAYDITAACTGFITGLSIGKAYIESGQYKRVLVAGSERLSSITNYEDRNTCVLFGDASGAVVLEATEEDRGVLATTLKSDGSYRELLWMKTGGSLNPITSEFTFDGSNKIYMAGAEVFKLAVKEMAKSALKVIDDAGLTSDDISLFVPHQANMRIIEAMAKRLNLPMERVFINLEKYGNTSAASVPLALDEANRQGRIKPGDHVVMVAFGGGMIWGAALVRW